MTTCSHGLARPEWCEVCKAPNPLVLPNVMAQIGGVAQIRCGRCGNHVHEVEDRNGTLLCGACR